MRDAGTHGTLRLRQEDVRGCFHCELPHQGFRPILWDILLRRNPNVANSKLRNISENERELIQLDAARTRFTESLVGDGKEANNALSRVLLAWLSSLPHDAEYRQGADSLAAVVLGGSFGRNKFKKHITRKEVIDITKEVKQQRLLEPCSKIWS